MLHQGVVDRDRRTGGEGLLGEAREGQIGRGLGDGRAAARDERGGEPLELGEELRDGEHEHAAVPGVFARGDELLRAAAVRLLDEFGDRMDAGEGGMRRPAADVAEAGLGAFGHDSEGREAPLPRGGRCRLDRLAEGLGVADHVVRRQHEQDRLGILRGDHQGRGHDRRRSVAGGRLEGDGSGGDPDFAQLLGNDEAVGIVAEHERRSEGRRVGDAQGGLLEQGPRTRQREQLLRIGAAGHRPEARARASRQDHGMDEALRGHGHGRRSSRFLRRSAPGTGPDDTGGRRAVAWNRPLSRPA